MAFPAVTGYASTVWVAIVGALTYFTVNADPTNPVATQGLAEAVAQTMANGRDAINAYDLGNGLSQAYINISPVIAQPLVLDPITTAFIEARLATLQAAAISVALLPPTPSLPSQTLPANTPVVPYPGLTEWMFDFAYETPPAGLTTGNFQAQAQAAATAWVTLANALASQGVTYTGATLNAVNWMGSAAQQVANDLSNGAITVSSQYSLTQAWNQLVALPACTRSSSVVTNDPTSAASQQSAVMRYIAGNAYVFFSQLVLQLEDSTPPNLQLATLRVGETLMDFASRTMGDFEQWYNIATFNNLVPPFVSPTGGVNVAQPGDKLYIPSTSTSSTSVTTVAATVSSLQSASYTQSFLGVDIYYGPLNQEMLPWGGDFQTISGYDNLANALGRRLQTTLGSLIYHGTFGSRIPPEVGAPQSTQTAQYIGAYAQSALLTDPRVDSLANITLTLQPAYALAFSCSVIPNGIGVSSVTVNEVIQAGVS